MNLLSLLAVVSTSSSTIIPITFTPNPPMELPQVGVPMIKAEFRALYGFISMRPHVIHFGAAGESLPADDEGIYGTFDYPQLRISTADDTLIAIARPRHHNIDWNIGRRRSAIGIGPGSDLLRAGGALDFVRQSSSEAFLRLGGSEHNFIANDCLSDSVMRMATVIGYSRRDLQDIYPVAHVETRFSFSIAGNVVSTDSVAILDSKGYVLTIPNTWYRIIYTELEPYRVPFESGAVFTDCNQALQRLPIITLTFSTHSLRLLPEDYTAPRYPEILRDTCELLIRAIPDSEVDPTIKFNPLMIPGMNARSTENEIILCNSATINP